MQTDQPYETYGALDFVQDSSFIRWVKGEQADAAFWEPWVRDHPEKAREIEEARRIVSSLQFREPPLATSRIEGLWQRIEGEVEAEENRSPTTAPLTASRWLRYAAAAAVALLVAAGFWLGNRSLSWQTAPGEQLSLSLPDGSSVRLNAATNLQYRKPWWSSRRQVRLRGEAFFEVRAGGPFTVSTDRAEVRVLGTQFNLSDRGGAFRVDCFEGRVGVTAAASADTAVLTAGRSARIDTLSNRLESFAFDPSRQATWRENIIYYQNQALGAVFDKLEWQYGVTVEHNDSIGNLRASGFYPLDNLDSALYYICWPQRLNYQQRGEAVIIRSEGK